MRRREVIAGLGAAAACRPLATQAQPGKPMPRIGVMPSGGVEGSAQMVEQVGAFKAGLEAHGWKEGRDIHIDYRWPASDLGRARAFAAELVSLAPAMIWTSGTIGLIALHEATSTIPIVFVNVTDPVAGGFVASLGRPGGNVTGITPFEYEIGGKWLQLLKEMAPGIRRVALLGDPDNHNFKGFQRSFESYAKLISVEPVSVAVRESDDLDRGIRAVASEANGGLIVTAAGFSIVYRDLIVAAAAKHTAPAIYWNRAQVTAGGLMSYGPNIADLSRQSATYVDRILKGAKPAELPVQGPIKIELIVNAHTAQALGLAVPAGLLAAADEVIE